MSLPLIAGNRADNKETFSHLPNIRPPPPPPNNVIYIIYEWYWCKSITYCAGGETFWSSWIYHARVNGAVPVRKIFSGADGYVRLIRVVTVQNISSWQMVGSCSGSIREYLMMYRGPGFSPPFDLVPPRPLLPLPSASCFSFLVSCVS